MHIKTADVIMIGFSIFALFFFLAQNKWIHALIAAIVLTLSWNDLFIRSPRK